MLRSRVVPGLLATRWLKNAIHREVGAPHATHTVVIARPRAEVFAFLADAEDDPSWRKGS